MKMYPAAPVDPYQQQQQHQQQQHQQHHQQQQQQQQYQQYQAYETHGVFNQPYPVDPVVHHHGQPFYPNPYMSDNYHRPMHQYQHQQQQQQLYEPPPPMQQHYEVPPVVADVVHNEMWNISQNHASYIVSIAQQVVCLR